MGQTERNETDTYLHDEGITGVLILNLIVSSLMLLSFAGARRLQRNLREQSVARNAAESKGLLAGSDSEEDNIEANDRSGNTANDNDDDDANLTASQRIAKRESMGRDRDFTMWSHFMRPDSDVISRGAGATNAYFYLRFQKALITVMSVCSFFGLCGLIPLYATGEHHLVGFSSATVDNVSYGSARTWGVCGFVYLFTAVTYFVLSRSESAFHADELRYFLPTRPAWTTVLILGVPTGQTCTHVETLLREYISNIYSCDFRPYSIPDVAELTHLEARRDRLHDKLERVTLAEEGRSPVMIRPKWYSLSKVRAVDHYTSQLSRCETKIRDISLRDDGWQRSTGCAFVTFPSVADAHQFVLDHLKKKDRVKRAVSTVSDDLNTVSWQVSPAPHPFEINWEFMGSRSLKRYGRYVMINFFVILIMLFFTTPVAVLSALREMAQSPWLKPYLSQVRLSGDLGELVYAMLPTVLLLLCSSLMPYVMYITAEMEQHSTRTDMEQSALRKTYLFLIVNTLLLPGLLLTSLDAFLEYSLSSDNVLEMLGRMFLINSGALFIHYVISSAFIGNAFDLVRMERIGRRWRSWRAVTTKDRGEASKVTPFMYGLEYALILSIFAICITFSVASPVIMPAGVLYLVFKYGVDKFNFLYVLPHEFVGETRLVMMSYSRVYSALMIMQCAMTGLLSLKGAYISASLCFLLFGLTLGSHLMYFSSSRMRATAYELPLQLWGDETPSNWADQATLFVHPSLRGDSPWSHRDGTGSRRSSVRPLTPDY